MAVTYQPDIACFLEISKSNPDRFNFKDVKNNVRRLCIVADHLDRLACSPYVSQEYRDWAEDLRGLVLGVLCDSCSSHQNLGIAS